MKQLLTIIIALFSTATVYAKCSPSGLYVFPSGESINQNSIFVLDGYASSQKIILELNNKYPIYLQSGNKKIKLIVTETCIGQFRLTQAVLKPEKTLEVGLEYNLVIEGISDPIYKYNKDADNSGKVKYKVVAQMDKNKPQVTGQLKELKKTFVWYGCGPSMHVVFSNPATDNSEIMVKTTVKDLKTSVETTFYLLPDGDKISVGHGMCAGGFDFEKNSNNYEVEFSFMDASNNVTNWTGERIKFSKPTSDNSYDQE